MAASLYSPLGSNQIRIARIEAGRPNNLVKCRLFRRHLSRNLDFQALSYDWRQQGGHVEIYCDNVALEVTRNLMEALKSLRRRDKHRFLWVDAICINQRDVQERSMQVRLMREIYASAKSVLVWLGPSFGGVPEAFKVIPYLARIAVERHPTGRTDSLTIQDLLCSQIDERPAHGSILQSKNASLYVRHDRDALYVNTIPPYTELSDDDIFHFGNDRVWTAVDALFNNSYFYRSWIVQEITVAEGVDVVCGRHIIDWDIFHVAYEGHSLLRFMTTDGRSNVMSVRDARRRYRSRGIENFHCLDLAQVLTSFTYSRESDARDRIYAAQGVVFPPDICDEIVPDYSKTLSEVFCDAARHIILFRDDLYLWSSKTFSCARSMPDLPTWVPEWTMSPCEEALEFCNPNFAGCLPGNL